MSGIRNFCSLCLFPLSFFPRHFPPPPPPPFLSLQGKGGPKLDFLLSFLQPSNHFYASAWMAFPPLSLPLPLQGESGERTVSCNSRFSCERSQNWCSSVRRVLTGWKFLYFPMEKQPTNLMKPSCPNRVGGDQWGVVPFPFLFLCLPPKVPFIKSPFSSSPTCLGRRGQVSLFPQRFKTRGRKDFFGDLIFFALPGKGKKILGLLGSADISTPSFLPPQEKGAGEPSSSSV